jgi:hypothetical protein
VVIAPGLIDKQRIGGNIATAGGDIAIIYLVIPPDQIIRDNGNGVATLLPR